MKTPLKQEPDPHRRGSLDLSQGGIQCPNGPGAVREVRVVPASQFETAENSAHGMGVSVVRTRDDGGEGARHDGFIYVYNHMHRRCSPLV